MDVIDLLTKPITNWHMIDVLLFMSIAIVFYMIASFLVRKFFR